MKETQSARNQAEYERRAEAAEQEGKRDYWRYQRGYNGEPPRPFDRESEAYQAGAKAREGFAREHLSER